MLGRLFDPFKKGIIEEALVGKTPDTDTVATDDDDTEPVDFNSEIKPNMIGLSELSPRISLEIVEYKEAEFLAQQFGLGRP